MASQLFSTFTEVGLVDTRSNAGTITLPKTIDIPYRQISLKDIYGNFQNKSLTLNTQFPDTFEDGTTSRVLTNAFGFTTLYAGPTNVWFTTGGTVLTSQTVSSLTVSTISGNGGYLTNLPAISSLSLQSTVQGLGTTGYISTQSLVSTVTSITYNYQTAGFVSSANLATLVSTPFLNTSLTSTVAAITYAYQTSGFLSTPTLTSTTAGITYNYQTAGFVSSANLATLVSTPFLNTSLTSTVAGLGQIYVSTVAAAISQGNLTSTIQGLGTLGYISSSQLTSTVAGLGQIYVSTVAAAISQSNLTSTIQGLGTVGYVSTTQVVSTVRGLGSSGYISSFSSFSTLLGLSTSISTLTTQYLFGTQAFISSLIVNSLSLGSNSAFIDMGDIIANSLSTTQINTNILYASSIFALNISGATTSVNLTSTVRGLGSSGYLSTSQLVSTVAGVTYGYQTSGFLSTPTLTSTVAGITYNYQTAGFISTPTIQSTTAGITYAYQTAGFLSSPTLISTVAGLGSATYISSPQLTSTTAGIYSFVNSFVDPTELTSTVVGLGTTGYVSTMGLLSTASGLASYITTFIDPNELASTVTGLGSASFVSTLQLTLNITSTVRGLGTVGYISSTQFLSTTRSYATYFTSLSASFSTITASNGYISSLRIDSLQIGPGDGWVDFGPLRAVAVSTLEVDTGSLYATSNFIGSVSSPFNAIQFYGLFGNFNNTVLAEVSTGAGTQELLLFKGSSSSDRIRLQTTGNIVFEPGSSARLWSSMSSNVTPAMIINTSSNVGIQTVSPQATLDVAGTGRFQAVSTLSLNISSINGQTFGAPIQSTVQGLGSAGYISTASLISTVSGSGSLFASTVQGLGSAGYISSSQLTSTVTGLGQIYVSTVAAAISQGNLTSTIQGLGTLGYISSSQLTSTVAGLGQIYVSTVAAAISQSNVTSTIQGLGTIGYISTTQVVSTVRGLGSSGYISSFSSFSTLFGLSTSISTLTSQYLYGTQGFISSLTVNSLILGATSGFIDLGDVIATTISTGQINATVIYASSIQASHISGALTSLNLVSTTAGITYAYQTAGYLSTPTLTSTTAGITYAYQTAGYVSSANLSGLVSTPFINTTLQSTITGLGTATYISSPQLTSTTAGIYSFVNSFVDPAELTSTVVGLGTTGYVSSMGLLSTASGLASYITTFIDPVELASTVTGLGSASFVSTLQLTLNITSTVQGLGTVGYISSSQLTSTNRSYATYFTSLSASFSSITASNVYASTLTVDNLQIGTGLGWVNIGPIQTVALSTNQVQTGSLYATSNYIGSVSSPFNAIQFYGLFGQYNNTVLAEVSTGAGTQELLFFKGSSSSDRIRLQTTGNIVFEPGSSSRLWPSMSSNATPAMIINTSSNVGIQTVSPQATLDVAGTGRFQIASTLELDVSTINGFIPFQPSMLQSTVAGLGQIYVSTVAAAISQSNLTSTVQGLGTVGYISTASLVSTFSASGSLFASTVTGLGTAGYISTASLVSTFSASGSLFASTVRGLGSASYLSTSQLTSTVQGLGTFGYISSLINRTILSTLALNVSSINGAVPATNFVGSTLFLSATQVLVSSQRNYNISSVLGFISSLQVDELQIGSGYGTLVFGDTQMSSVSSLVVTAGLGQFVTVSSIFLNVSTINGTAPWQQSFLTSTTRGLGTLGYISTSQLVSTVAGLNTGGGITQTNITSTVQGLGTVGYISTASLVSTFSASGSLFASTVAGLGSATYISSPQLTSTTAGIYTFVNSFVDPAELTSTVVGLGTTGYVSTMGLLSTASGLAAYITTFIDPAELASTVTGLGSASFVSTLQLNLNITSTVRGLGTVGYISSAQLISTGASYSNTFRSLSASFSSLTASNVFASTLTVDNLVIGSGLGWIDFPALRSPALSTIQLNAGSVYASSNFVGSVSSPFNTIQFYGLFGNYNNTVLAEVSTGAGTQELLLFKGSSSSDRIRLQTTGNIVFEPGSSARLWPSMLSNATPAMIINTSSNVGIQTASPQTTLDVAGTGRFQTVSTLAFNTSSINGQTFGGPIQSTVRGLGSSGYISTSQLVSTVQSLESAGGGWVGTATSDLNMNGYNITSVNGLGIGTTAGSILISAIPTLPYPLDLPSTAVFTFATDIFGVADNSLLLTATSGTDLIAMSTGILFNTSNSISSLSAYNAIHQTPDFIVSTCKNSYYIQNVRQPFIQYGEVGTSGSNSNVQIVLQIPYSSILGYQAFATMNDTTAAEVSVVKTSPSTFTVYWENGSFGPHAISWNTMGNVEACEGGPAQGPAINLDGTFTGSDYYTTWDVGAGTPDSYVAYLQQSSNDFDWVNYVDSGDIYTNSWAFYSLPDNNYYRFYVKKGFPGPIGIDSSNSASDFLPPA